MVIGIDEVGRGSWAGPLVFAGVLLPEKFEEIKELDDSKKLSAVKRSALCEVIKNKAKFYIVVTPHNKIDELGLTAASRDACIEIVNKMYFSKVKKVIIDGNVNYLKETPFEKYTETIIKADTYEPNTMAASIIAKHHRDQIMIEKSKLYPGYDFDKNFGYGTIRHINALKKLGVTEIHRKSYKPIKKLL